MPPMIENINTHITPKRLPSLAHSVKKCLLAASFKVAPQAILMLNMCAQDWADDSYLDDLLLSRIRVFANFRGVPGLDNAAIDMLHERITATAVKIKPCIICVYGNTVMVAEMYQ